MPAIAVSATQIAKNLRLFIMFAPETRPESSPRFRNHSRARSTMWLLPEQQYQE
jgi:hypothetical protein